MPRFQIHIGSIDGVDPDELAEKVGAYYEAQLTDAGPGMGKFALMDEFVLMGVSAKSKKSEPPANGVFDLHLARRVEGEITILRQDLEKKKHEFEIGTKLVQKVIPIHARIFCKSGRIETYGPGPSSLEHAADGFLINALGLPVLWNWRKIDLVEALDKLAATVERLRLVKTKVTDYSHNSYMIGPYAPTFLDSQHGMDFTNEYVAGVAKMSIKFTGPAGKIGLNLSAKSSFTGTVKDEADLDYVYGLCRRLCGYKDKG